MGLRDYSEYESELKLFSRSLTSVLATYSNLENHPRLIRARQVKATPKMTLDSKTGLPIVGDVKASRKRIEPIEEESQDVERRK
jgi:protein LTV1